jgi:hypothetical protein
MQAALLVTESGGLMEILNAVDPVAKAHACGGAHQFVRPINDQMENIRFQRLRDAGVILSPTQVENAIREGRVQDIEHMDEVCEGIESASDKEKTAIIRAIAETMEYGYWAGGYSEVGYNDPERGVLLGDWNHRDSAGTISESQYVSIAEACGAEVEWHDMWKACSDCHKAVRCSPDSYSWTRSYVEWDGEISCHECMEDDDHKQSFLEEQLEDNSDLAELLGWDLEELGYTRLDEDFQNGLYGGQSASPHKIATALRERGISRFVFQIDSVGQFDARFSCWVHEDDMPEEGISFEANEADGHDPATAMKAALQDASAQMSKLSGEGVKVATCNADGTATVRVVSQEDFIEGNAFGGE